MDMWLALQRATKALEGEALVRVFSMRDNLCPRVARE